MILDGNPGAPSVSGIFSASTLNGARFGLAVNALYIGMAEWSTWFMGLIPRICSIVRTTSTCV